MVILQHNSLGRQLRTTIPQLPTSLLPRWPNIRGFRKQERRAKENQRRIYNQRHRVRTLQPLQRGQNVWLPKERTQVTVIQQATTPRSFIIDTDLGQVRRNRTHMRTLTHSQHQTPPDAVDKTTEQTNTETHTNTNLDTKEHKQTHTTRTAYVTASGRVSRAPERLDL